jgi:hypothetical protein
LVCGPEETFLQSAKLDLRAGLDHAVHFDGRGRLVDMGTAGIATADLRADLVCDSTCTEFSLEFDLLRWHAIAGALGEISILWLAILATMVLFWELHPLAGWLMVAYLAWVSFATVLNLGIFRLNRNR